MFMTEHLFVINGVKISKDSRYESWLSCSLKVETVYLRCRKKENEEFNFMVFLTMLCNSILEYQTLD
jgi:hypothetical protein